MEAPYAPPTQEDKAYVRAPHGADAYIVRAAISENLSGVGGWGLGGGERRCDDYVLLSVCVHGRKAEAKTEAERTTTASRLASNEQQTTCTIRKIYIFTADGVLLFSTDPVDRRHSTPPSQVKTYTNQTKIAAEKTRSMGVLDSSMPLKHRLPWRRSSELRHAIYPRLVEQVRS